MPLAMLWQVVIWIGSTLLLKALTPKIKSPAQPQPEAQRPNTDEGDPIPFGFGRFRAQPHIVWWGDKERVPFKEVIQPAGLFNIEHLATVAYDFKFGAQMAICWGRVDRLNDIVFDDDRLVSQSPGSRVKTGETGIGFGGLEIPTYGTLDNVSPNFPINNSVDFDTDGTVEITIHESELFGGRKSGGGLDGVMRFYFGNDGSPLPNWWGDPPNPPTVEQPPNEYLETVIPLDTSLDATERTFDIPSYPWLCYAVAEKMNWGESQAMHKVAFDLNRWPRFLRDRQEGSDPPVMLWFYEAHIIGNNANGAEVVTELLLNKDYGLGQWITEDDIDFPSFCYVAWLLKLNNIGVSGLIDSKESVKSIIEEVQRHSDFVLVYDQVIGKLTMVTTLTIPQFGPPIRLVIDDGMMEITSHKEAGWRSRVNEVKCSFTNADRNFNEDIAQVEDLSMMEKAGHRITEQVSFPLFTDRTTAQNRAWRVLWELQGPQQIEAIGTRALSHLRPGDVVRIESAQFNIFGNFVVGDIDYGLIDDGKIGISLIENVFQMQIYPYGTTSGAPGGTPSSPTWREPVVLARKETDDDGATGVAILYVEDPYSTITLVEFAEWEPGDGAPTYATSGVYYHTVALNQKGGQRIYWRVTYELEDGVTTATKEGYVEFGKTTADPPTLALALTYDDDGILDASAIASASVTSVKFAVSTADGPPPSQSTIEAAAADSSSPFTASAMADMEPGERRIVGAIGYTSAGEKVGPIWETIFFPAEPDDGGDGGGSTDAGGAETGDRLIYFLLGYGSTPDHAMTNLAASPDTDIGLGTQRHNLANAALAEIQTDCRTAGSANTQIGIKRDSAEGGSYTNWLVKVPIASTGVKLARVPIPNAVRDLGSIFLKAYATGGDGAADPAVRTLLLRTIQGPRESFGALGGSMMFDYNANNIAQGDGTNTATWLDDSGNNNNATGQSAIYRVTGFGGLDFPFVDVSTGTDTGFYASAAGYPGDETIYMLVNIISGTGSTTGASTIFNAPGGSGEQGALYVQSNGIMYASAGNSFFGWPQAGGSNVVAGTGIHMLRFTVGHGSGTVRLFVDGVQEIVFGNALIVNGWWNAWRYFGNFAGYTGLECEFHSVQRWSAYHEVVGLNTIENTILARVGL